MLAPDRPLWEKADAIKDVEHACDNLTHEIIQRLHRTFVTPLDREDIHMLASSLDDVIDAIDEAAANVRLYRLDHVRTEARVMAGIIKSCTDQIVVALRAFERRGGVAPAAVELNRLENEADRVHQNALQRLFAEETDPILDHEVEGSHRPARGSCRPLRGRGQRRRRGRREARLIDRWIRTCWRWRR